MQMVKTLSISWAAAVAATIILSMSTSHLAGAGQPSARADYFVYVGVYGKGVYAYRFHPNGPKLDELGLVGTVTNPSFVITDRDYKFLYAVSELEGKETGGVASFAIDRATGSLRSLNSVPSAGVAPCHLALDHTGKMLIVANYTTGGVSSFSIGNDGRIGNMGSLMTAQGSSVNRERQEGPHAHEVVISADNQFAYVPDLGLDEIRTYRLDPGQGKLTPNNPPFIQQQPGFGPRHMVFSPDGQYAYVVNELKSFVTVSKVNGPGDWQRVQDASTLPENFHGENGPAEILIDRSGKFLYASNRGPGTIAVFAVNQQDGMLRQVQIAATGNTFPRGVEFDPTGQYLFAGDQKANQFVIFRVDRNTGQLTLTGQSYKVPSPVSFAFVPVE
jgi:6-phosphogluconolactonase